MKKALFIVLTICIPFSMYSKDQKTEKDLSEKVITGAQLTAGAALFFLSSRCVYNAYLINENPTSFPRILTCFYHGWVAFKEMLAIADGPHVSITVPHLPLIATSGAIMALSGVYLKNKIQELIPKYRSSTKVVHN